MTDTITPIDTANDADESTSALIADIARASGAQRRAMHARLAATLRPAGYDVLLAEQHAAAGKVAAAEAAILEAQDRVWRYQKLVEIAAALEGRVTETKRQIGNLVEGISKGRAFLIEHAGEPGGYFHPIQYANDLAAGVIGKAELDTALVAIAKLAEDALTAAEEYAAANGISAPTE